MRRWAIRSFRRRAEGRHLLRDGLRARFSGHASGRVRFLGYEKPPNGQLVDFQPADTRATDCQSTDGKCTDGCCADCNCSDCNCAECEPGSGKRPSRKSTKGSRGSVHRPQFASLREPWGHAVRSMLRRCPLGQHRGVDVPPGCQVTSLPSRSTPRTRRRSFAFRRRACQLAACASPASLSSCLRREPFSKAIRPKRRRLFPTPRTSPRP